MNVIVEIDPTMIQSLASANRRTGRAFRRTLLLLAVITVVGTQGLAVAQPQDDLRPVFKPHGPCFSTHGGNQVLVDASPDLGGADPTVLVLPTSMVHLSGIARSYHIRENCETTFKPLSFKWELTGQDFGGVFTDQTALLVNANTLTPTFKPAGDTTYVASLTAGGDTATARIEVLAGGRSWYSIGPNGSVGPEGTGYAGVGRVNHIIFDPTDPATLYAATAQGGVFKTVDRGEHWFPITDHKGLPNLGISALTAAPGSPTTIFAAIGDNWATSSVRVPVGSGTGIWRSSDGGVTWAPLGPVPGTTCPAGTSALNSRVNRIVVDPQNAAIVFSATGSGLFRSTDGGSCWSNFVGITAIVSDLVLDGATPAALYAAVPSVGIFRIPGASAASPPSGPPAFSFTPPFSSWVVLAVAPSSPASVYAAVANISKNGAILLKTIDAGSTWATIATTPCASQCDFGMALAVDPTDANHVIYGEVGKHHSIDGGRTFTDIGNASTVHDDLHALVFAPDNPRVLYAATDGGVYRTGFGPGPNHTPDALWQTRNLDLSIAQAFQLALPPPNPQAAAIGVWDNGTEVRQGGRTWSNIQRGDGFVVAADAASDQIIYYNANAGTGSLIERYPDQAQVATVVGVANNPFRAGELFGIGVAGKGDGKLYVSRGSDQAAALSWVCADVAPAGVAASTIDFTGSGTYYLGSNDGRIYRFTLPDTLPNATLCSSSTAAVGAPIFPPISAQAPSLVVDPFNQQSLYVLVPGAPTAASRVVKYARNVAAVVAGGPQWVRTDIAGGLSLASNVQLTAIGADPSVSGLVYLGTTNGLYEGLPDTTGVYRWALNTAVPDTYIAQIVAHRGSAYPSTYSGELRVTTYGRGVWERQITLTSTCRALHCFKPKLAAIKCLTCERTAFQPQPTNQNSEAWVSIPYVSKASPGPQAVVSATPLINGKRQPFFLAEGSRARKGNNTALVQLRYEAADAPLGIRTDALLLELMASPEGPVLARQTMGFGKWWVRPDARLLTIDSVYSDPMPRSVPAAVTVRLDGRLIEGKTPLTLPVPVGARATIQIQPTVEVERDALSFAGWGSVGATGEANPAMSITVTDNAEWIARYVH